MTNPEIAFLTQTSSHIALTFRRCVSWNNIGCFLQAATAPSSFIISASPHSIAPATALSVLCLALCIAETFNLPATAVGWVRLVSAHRVTKLVESWDENEIAAEDLMPCELRRVSQPSLPPYGM